MEKLNHEEDFLQRNGLEIAPGKVEVGQSYPIFGMITKLSKDEEGKVIAEINNNIVAHMTINDGERLDVLKGKAFETGIFFSKVLAVEPAIEVECKAVIFGKSQAFNA